MSSASSLRSNQPRSAEVTPIRSGITVPVVDVPAPVPIATLTAVIEDAVQEVLAEVAQLVPRAARAEYVAPGPGACAPSLQCLPLGPVLGTDPAATGHLHVPSRPADTCESSGTAGTPEVDDDGQRTDEAPPVSLAVVGRMIAANVHRDLLDVQLARSRHEVGHLQAALESNRMIGVAIGVLMTTQRCTATHAFELLKEASQTQNRKLRDVAADVQYTGAITRPSHHMRRA